MPRLSKNSQHLYRTYGFISIFLTSILLPGCGQNRWQAKTFPAEGSVSINGASPQGAVVILESLAGKIDSRGTNPWGVVQADGTYALSMYHYGDGVPKGDYAVTLRWPNDDNPPKDRLKGAFATAEHAPLTVTIDSGKNQIPPIILTDIRLLP